MPRHPTSRVSPARTPTPNTRSGTATRSAGCRSGLNQAPNRPPSIHPTKMTTISVTTRAGNPHTTLATQSATPTPSTNPASRQATPTTVCKPPDCHPVQAATAAARTTTRSRRLMEPTVARKPGEHLKTSGGFRCSSAPVVILDTEADHLPHTPGQSRSNHALETPPDAGPTAPAAHASVASAGKGPRPQRVVVLGRGLAYQAPVRRPHRTHHQPERGPLPDRAAGTLHPDAPQPAARRLARCRCCCPGIPAVLRPRHRMAAAHHHRAHSRGVGDQPESCGHSVR